MKILHKNPQLSHALNRCMPLKAKRTNSTFGFGDTHSKR